ncbi:CvpA family protein [Neisseria leonii]|uniref:CvpA family protein n=1 Tax=Neisseria leonii TaxID=2995413 RepID=UPI00237A681B|nr:CvpA family protein [Neisseria sp. 3986]MDD9324775.1 CvpA family protein [Neisseria sp. 3986]
MTLFDLLALGVIVLSACVSAIRGAVSEVIALSAWLAAFWVAKMGAQPFAQMALTSVEPPALAWLAGFVLVFVAVRLALGMLRPLLTAGLSAVGMGAVNRLFGLLIGAGKGILLVTLAVLVCAFTDLPRTQDWQNAVSAPYFQSLAGLAAPYLPDYLAEQIRYPAF